MVLAANQFREFHFTEFAFGPDLIVVECWDIAVEKKAVVAVAAKKIDLKHR